MFAFIASLAFAGTIGYVTYQTFNDIEGTLNMLNDNIVFKKIGGLYHWRVFRLGGSFYLKKSKGPTLSQRLDKLIAEISAMVKPEPEVIEVCEPVKLLESRLNLALRKYQTTGLIIDQDGNVM